MYARGEAPLGQPQRISALQTLAYTYDAVGNIRTISDALTSATVTRGPAPCSETYGYTTSGNPSIYAGQACRPSAA